MMHYAKNIVWGPLSDDGSVKATFDYYLNDELISAGENITAKVHYIQDAIVATCKGQEIEELSPISYEEYVDLYDSITQSEELFFE